SVGQYASLVEALALYLDPTLEPERTIPPGNGTITSATALIAFTAASAAARVNSPLRPMIKRLPPPTAVLVSPVTASHTNSPSITGTHQYALPPKRLEIC